MDQFHALLEESKNDRNKTYHFLLKSPDDDKSDNHHNNNHYHGYHGQYGKKKKKMMTLQVFGYQAQEIARRYYQTDQVLRKQTKRSSSNKNHDDDDEEDEMNGQLEFLTLTIGFFNRILRDLIQEGMIVMVWKLKKINTNTTTSTTSNKSGSGCSSGSSSKTKIILEKVGEGSLTNNALELTEALGITSSLSYDSSSSSNDYWNSSYQGILAENEEEVCFVVYSKTYQILHVYLIHKHHTQHSLLPLPPPQEQQLLGGEMERGYECGTDITTTTATTAVTSLSSLTTTGYYDSNRIESLCNQYEITRLLQLKHHPSTSESSSSSSFTCLDEVKREGMIIEDKVISSSYQSHLSSPKPLIIQSELERLSIQQPLEKEDSVFYKVIIHSSLCQETVYTLLVEEELLDQTQYNHSFRIFFHYEEDSTTTTTTTTANSGSGGDNKWSDSSSSRRGGECPILPLQYDHHVIQGLHIFSSTSSSSSTSSHSKSTEKDNLSLFHLLQGSCHTSQGNRLLRQWIRNPLTIREEILERQTRIAYYLHHPSLLSTLQDQLKKFPDLENLILKLKSSYHYQTKRRNESVSSTSGNATSSGGSGKSSLESYCWKVDGWLKLLVEIYKGLLKVKNITKDIQNELLIDNNHHSISSSSMIDLTAEEKHNPTTATTTSTTTIIIDDDDDGDETAKPISSKNNINTTTTVPASSSSNSGGIGINDENKKMIDELDNLVNGSSLIKFMMLIEDLVDSDHIENIRQDKSAFPTTTTTTTTSSGNTRQKRNELVFYREHFLRVRPSYDITLQSSFHTLQSIEETIITQYQDMIKMTGLKMKDIQLEYSDIHGLHYRVTKLQSNKVLKQLESKGYTVEILSLQKAGTLFLTSQLKKKAMELNKVHEEYTIMQSHLVYQASEVALTFLPFLLQCGELIAKLDVFCTLAQVSLINDWKAPTFQSKGCKELSITGVRHPLLEDRIGCMAVVPNDVTITNDQYVQLLTGPNMGGKSTYLRAIGLTVILAQIGCFVPATSACLPIYDRIFIRSGSIDNITAKMSTFMVELVELSNIMKEATDQSLVLIDEIGRGTSTNDGLGLAWAILEYLALNNQCTVFCTTHLHELTKLTQTKIDNVNNPFVACHVSAVVNDARKDDLTMLYKVCPGGCDLSLGISVAKMVNFPEEVIEEAWEIEEELVKQGKATETNEPFLSTDLPNKRQKIL